MSDSVWPHRRQPTRLPHPWDSPGKNTGVGCHFLFQCMKVKSESEVAQLYLTLSDRVDCSLPGSSVHGFSRQEYWSGVPLPSLVPQPCCSTNPSVQSRVHLPQWCSLCSHPCQSPSDLQSKVQRHKEGSENIIWNGRYKRTNSHSIKEVPTFAGCKVFESEFDIFDQSVEVEIAHSLYSLKFSFLWFKFFIAVKQLTFISFFSVWFISNFPLCQILNFSKIFPNLIHNIYNPHFFHG